MPPVVKYSKEKIISIALNLVEKEGIEFISARNIAKELGSSICPVFSCFESMDKLKKELIKRIYEVYIDYLRAGIDDDEKKYRGAGLAYIRFAREKPNYFKVLFMSMNGNDTSKLLKNDHSVEEIVEIICLNTGLSKENALKLHEYNWIFGHGIASMLVTGYSSFDDEKVFEMLSRNYQALVSSFKEDK